jgi:hypothetical protein
MGELKELLPEKAEIIREVTNNRMTEAHQMGARRVRIKLEDMSLIQGEINIFSEPARDFDGLYDKHLDDQGTYYRRISDLFTKGKNAFIVVFNVVAEGQTGGVLIVNKNKILWIYPED